MLKFRCFNITPFGVPVDPDVYIKYDILNIVFGISVVIVVAILNNRYSLCSTLISIAIVVIFNVAFNRRFLKKLANKLLDKIKR